MELKRAAIIGCGPRAAEHVAAYRLVDRGQVVAVCARDGARSEAFAREHGVNRSYADAAVMIETERPDLVHIVTDPGQRLALMTLVHDLDVPVAIVEKPIALDVSDLAAIRELTGGSSTRFVVNTQLRYHPRLVALQHLVDTGRIGDVRFIDASAGSTILDQGVHLIDLAAWFTGEAAPTRIFAQVAGAAELDSPQPCPDGFGATIELDGGVRFDLVSGETAPFPRPDEPFYMQKRIAVYGTRGFVHWTMWGWEATDDAGRTVEGSHDYGDEDVRAQAQLTEDAFALLDDGTEHPCRVERALQQFDVVLGGYVSALDRRPVTLPCTPLRDLLGPLRTELHAT